MTEKEVVISIEARKDMGDVSDFIIAVSRPSHAERYSLEVLAELNTLSYMATMLPEPEYRYPKRFHPEAKMIKLPGKPLSAIFHIESEHVIVDRIIHSSMITYRMLRCNAHKSLIITHTLHDAWRR